MKFMNDNYINASSVCESNTILNDEEILKRAQQILTDRFMRSNYLTSPNETRNFLKLLFAEESRELFVVIFLDNQNGVLDHQCLFKGSIDSATVYPREVVKAVLDRNAASVILSHNHPSGSPEPSTQDKFITSRIINALETIDVRVLDHVIVGGPNTMSFAERGLL
jgi:DNA repair protein RadC